MKQIHQIDIEELCIKFQGFHPTDFTRSYLRGEMSAIHDEAPYGSALKAIFSRRNQSFKGVVAIHSSAGRFFAVASGTKLKEVVQRLVEQLRKQLQKWKDQRFQKNGKEDLYENFDGLAQSGS
ncbi:hypothetical protein QJS83_01875 [Bdellovibrio sp. 22V]|uniref:hypothetical protein n=1 Tax=Bdellovibrio sp. 22V TaxID=3044166 RepID=UPI00254348C0|nr:hypothetical protein [Bdellovibrio sp. 22V]WII72618.1 hypothetical protein QJS83_01875 [Bdellovibrio sp. 22V]